VVGSLQVRRKTTPEYRHAGIDLFVAPEYQGRGLGPGAIRLARPLPVRGAGAPSADIDPAAENLARDPRLRACRVPAGGIMRQYERGRDGTWHDGLLMDLLVGELREP